MLKQLRVICTLMLLVSMSLLPMEKEDEFAQEKEFHERLQYAYHGILQDGTQSYYKKIDPITSTPAPRADRWNIACVSIAGKKMYTSTNGAYTHGDISFTIDPAIIFNPTQPLNIWVTHGKDKKREEVDFKNPVEKKVPVCHSSLECYKDITDAIGKNKLLFIRYVTLKGIVRIPEKDPCDILIEYRNQYAHPIILRGIQIILRKNEKITNIFLDLADLADEPVNHFNPIELTHSSITADDKILCIENHKAYECTGKKIYRFFDSPETRTKWVPDESNFYDLDNQILTSLPKFYSNSNDHQERLNKPLTCMLDDIDIDNLLYQVPDEIWKLIFLAQNKYSIIEPDMYPQEKAAIQWCAMKNIVNTSLVCKKFNATAQKLLSSYTKEIKGYIDALGGKDKATYRAFTKLEYGKYWFKVTEICKVMEADLNHTKHTEIGGGNTLLTQAIRNKDTYQIEHLLKKGADPKYQNRKGDMPIDLAYANGFLEAARMIKDNGGDPEDKYEYKDDTFVCKQGQGGQAYTPQQANDFDDPGNPDFVPTQASFLPSRIMGSYMLLGGISVGAVAYWLYTKYRAVDEDVKEEQDSSDVDAENENGGLNSAQPNVTYF